MKTILLIEDNRDIRENLIEYLEMAGYKIISAQNGKRGIELAIAFIPDLIICDVLMPVMDGHQFLVSLLETESTSQIPFIFSSSMFEKKDVEIALQNGADDYIAKPYEMEALLKVIEIRVKFGSKRKKNKKINDI